jgi:hypothetical protein
VLDKFFGVCYYIILIEGKPLLYPYEVYHAYSIYIFPVTP